MAVSASPTKWQRSLTALITFVLVILTIACLYWARTVLIPVALAILLTFLLSPLVTALQRRGLRRVPSVIVVVALAGLLLAGLGWVLTAQVTGLANDLPAHQENITRKLADLRGLSQQGTIEKVSRTFKEVTEELDKQRPPAEPASDSRKKLPVPPVPVVIEERETPLSGFDQIFAAAGPLLEPLAEAGLVVVLVIFMLISREDLRNRLIRLIGHGNITLTTKALDEAGQRISRYLLMQLLINGTFGLAIGIGLFLIGVPYAPLWGFLAAVLRYIPYLGPWLAAALPLAVSLITFPGWWPLLLVIGLFLVCELISNMIMEPKLYGQSIGVSEAALLIAVAFWTWVWGPMGLVLATPLTVCLVVLGKYVPYLHFFDVLLGDKPALDTDVRYYQRLLARDQDEAADVAEEELKTASLEQVYDNVMIPALTSAKRDRENDQLTESEAEFIIGATREIVDELGIIAAKTTTKEDSAERDLPAVPIIACPARDEADEAALHMLRRLLEPTRCEVEITPSELLASEVIALVEEKRPPVLCVAALPPGGLAHTRYLCLRLRARFPDLKLVIARWGLKANVEKNREQLLAAGADYLGTTLAETRAQIVECLLGVRHFDPPAAPAERQSAGRGLAATA